MINEYYLNLGSFNCKINTNINSVLENLNLIYGDHPSLKNDAFINFNITVKYPNFLRSHVRPQACFYLDEHQPFMPLPATQGFAMVEWGLNWCIANHAHQHLIFHAAVVEKNGVCAILPAPPGSGKSTLCANLVLNGWRLLSDELTLVNLNTGNVHPVIKPINLKNNSIDIIKSHFPQAVFSSIAHDTHKGTVALLKPTQNSIDSLNKTTKATHVIFPKYEAQSLLKTQNLPVDKHISELIANSFNYHLLGEKGFKALIQLTKQTQALHLTYSKFEDSLNFFNGLSDELNINS